MKEIGIEKLIELLNEYEIEREMEIGTFELGKIPYREWSLDTGDLVFEPNYKDKKYEDCIGDTANSVLISKSFGFIKWLVENDKIDTSKANDKNLNGYEIELRIRAVKELVADSEEKTVLYLNLLMLLAIQDEPIRFLCEIIK